MTVWALADLHLSFGVPNKSMEAFGEPWIGYTQKIRDHWLTHISPNDLVLIPGDISWAMHLEEVRIDLQWIHELPGTKVMIRGNHDYWWTSLSKIEKILPPSIHLIQNNIFQWENIQVAGTRLWDSSEYHFNEYINYLDNPRAKKLTGEGGGEGKDKNQKKEEDERLFKRELDRLETSLKCFNKPGNLNVSPSNVIRIAMVHYPPIGADLVSSQTSQLLEKYDVNICVFGHLHNVKKDKQIFGSKNNVYYHLTSCDYLEYNPIKIL